MKILEQENLSVDRDAWNALVSNSDADFLQSYQWAEFQKSIGQKVIRQEIAGMSVQIIKYLMPMGQSYLYGPHIRIKNQESRIRGMAKEILFVLQDLARKENSIFLRVDFLAEQETGSAAEMQQALCEANFQPAPANYYFSAVSQSPFVAHLDISGSEEQILSAMRYNTRRSIRLAQERGVVVEQTEDIESFFNLLTRTSQRKNVSLHPREHYFKLKQAFGEDLFLLLAHNDKLLAGAMILFFGEQATYLHAGSLSGSQNQEAPYLILWRAIQEAKKRGCKILDLGAVAPEGSQDHPWKSITTFKMGWRPKPVSYMPAYDWINKSWWYKLYCWKKNLK